MVAPSLSLIFLGTLSAVPVDGPPTHLSVRPLSPAKVLEIGGAFTVEVRPGSTPRLTIDGPAEQVIVESRPDRIRIDRVANTQGPIHLLVELPGVESLTITGAHDIHLPAIRAAHFQLTASGASRVTLAGQVEQLSARVSGAVSLTAQALIARRVEVGAHGSSQVMVRASERLGVDASGTSHVEYVGRPAQIVPKLSGLASVGTTEV